MEHNQRPAKREKTLFSFFKKKEAQEGNQPNNDIPTASNVETSVLDLESPPTSHIIEQIDFDGTLIERDLGLRIQMWEYPVNRRDEIRRAYIKARAY